MNVTPLSSIQLRSLVIFRNILRDPVISRLERLLDAASAGTAACVDAYADFAAALLAHSDDFSSYLLGLLIEDENGAFSKEMLDILFENVSIDLNTVFDFGGSAMTLCTFAVGETENYVSEYAGKKTAIEAAVQAMLDAYEDMQ